MFFSTKILPSTNQEEQQPKEANFDITTHKPNKVSFVSDTDFNEVIKEINEGDLVIFWTKGRWSMHQLIKHFVELLGTSEVTLCTWAMSEEPLRVLHNLKSTGKISKITGLFEHKIKNRGSQFAFAEQFFDEVLLGKCHAKVTVIEGVEKSVSIICSANLTKNKRIEAGMIFCNQDAAIQNKKNIINGFDN